MTFLKKTLIVLCLLVFAEVKVASAQLWRYLNDSPEKEKAADRALKKEAFSVVTRKTIAYGDTLSYDIMTFALKSFDGATVKIDLWEKPFSDRVFHIDLPNDKLIIPDFYALARVHHLSTDLLEIVYSPRGGSDDGYDNVLLLGVEKNKFCIVLEIQSLHEFDGPGMYGLYNLHLKLTGNRADNYQLNIQVHDLLKSDSKKKSYDHNSSYQLKFDKSQHLFYTSNQKLDAYIYRESAKARKRHITGIYPTIDLGQERYCLFDNIWYAVWKDKFNGEITMYANCQRAK